MGKKIISLLRLPNLLSLDAPFVAIIWVLMLKEHYRVPFIDYPVIFVLSSAVWCIYVLDRILDVKTGRRKVTETDRHAFSWKYRKVLLVCVFIIAIIALYLAITVIPCVSLTAGIALCGLCVLYFLLIPSQSAEIPYLKNLIAGVVFAIGVAIPIRLLQVNVGIDIIDVFTPIFDSPDNVLATVLKSLILLLATIIKYISLLIGSIEVFAFALVCMLNISLIDLWERKKSPTLAGKFKVDDAFISLFMLVLFIALIVIGSVQNSDLHPLSVNSYFFYTLAAATGLLFLLNKLSNNFNLEDKRVLADIALVAPALLYLTFIS